MPSDSKKKKKKKSPPMAVTTFRIHFFSDIHNLNLQLVITAKFPYALASGVLHVAHDCAGTHNGTSN